MNRQDFNIDDFRQHSNPYTVPEGYFSKQQQALMQIPSRHSSPRRFRLIHFISIAATFAVIVTLAMLFIKPAETPADLDSYIATLTDTELSQSIELDNLDIYSEFIID
ncbi:MAG: hypothetical protein K2O00_00885 [Muribaculaceae bacterium]|nr:hypothetical protein [Muribaculaceae bacterium]